MTATFVQSATSGAIKGRADARQRVEIVIAKVTIAAVSDRRISRIGYKRWWWDDTAVDGHTTTSCIS